MEIVELLFKLILSHLIGDYVLQIDFIAKTKGNNIYHLLVHCILYAVPFYLWFGFTWHLIPLIIIHFVVDLLKARYKLVPYWLDQLLHYLTCLLYLI